MIKKLPGHGVSAAVGGRNFNVSVLFCCFDDAKQAHLGVRFQAVARLALDGGGATASHPRQALQQQSAQFGVARLARFVHSEKNAAAARVNFQIRSPSQLEKFQKFELFLWARK